jgi:hypothetical protein
LILPPRIMHGSVITLLCCSCVATIPIFGFEGDTDTIGLCSASSCDQLDLAIIECSHSEWSDIALGHINALENRIANTLGRNDLHIPKIRRIEKVVELPAGIGFAEFRKRHRPPLLVYYCPCCSSGEAVEQNEFTVSGFKAIGGRIFTIGNLVLEGDEQA